MITSTGGGVLPLEACSVSWQKKNVWRLPGILLFSRLELTLLVYSHCLVVVDRIAWVPIGNIYLFFPVRPVITAGPSDLDDRDIQQNRPTVVCLIDECFKEKRMEPFKKWSWIYSFSSIFWSGIPIKKFIISILLTVLKVMAKLISSVLLYSLF